MRNNNNHIDIDFSDLDREVVKDPAVLRQIVKDSGANVQTKTGFWLFAEEFIKDDAYLEFGENSPWDPTYFVYRDYNDNIVAMRSFRVKDPIVPGYAHMMAMQVLSQYNGNHLSKGITNDTIQYIKRHYPNILGITLIPREHSLENLYKKYGYKTVVDDGFHYMIRKFNANKSAEPMRCNVLYPGGFKPVHDGHLSVINRWLSEDNTFVYVIISKKDRQGLSPYTSKWFLDQVFGTRRNFVSVVTDYPSPIRAVYNYTATKEFGDGIYAMVSSNKEGDATRTTQFIDSFKEGGKYYTPGVYVNEISPEDAVLFTARDDDYVGSPVSSTILRQDIIDGNYNRFMSGYELAFRKGWLDPEVLDEYYNRLRHEIQYPKLEEGGAAGHMSHPYEDSEMTFRDIHDMMTDLFQGKITDITEKLDGINIFASVDMDGRTIFARNRTQLRNTPMLMDDILNNDRWQANVKESFRKGAETITEVFNNIPKKIDFFNHIDGLDGLKYRNWCNIEIIDHDSVNVIPYVENMISFHTIVTTCEKISPDNSEFTFNVFEDPNISTDFPKIEAAIKNTNKSVFKAQTTPRIIIRQSNELNNKLDEYDDELEEIMYQYKLNQDSTITDYKYAAFYKYLMSHDDLRKQFHGSYDDFKAIAERWSGKRKVDLRSFEHITRDALRDFESKHLKNLSKKIMMPIDRFFINLGNDVIKVCDGLSNINNHNKVIEKLKADIVKTIDEITKSGNKAEADQLEYLLVRLGDQTAINAAEGIVFKYHGRTYKLTGSFAVLNQILGLRKYKKES